MGYLTLVSFSNLRNFLYFLVITMTIYLDCNVVWTETLEHELPYFPHQLIHYFLYV